MGMRLTGYCLLFIFFIASASCSSQTGYLFVKKGMKKKLSLTLGDPVHFRLKDKNVIRGVITGFRSDTVVVNGWPVDTKTVYELLLPQRPKKPFPDGATLAGITAGAGLTATGLILSKQEEATDAILTGLAIGYGPLLIKHFGGRLLWAIPRKKFRMGKKFRLQVLDLSLPGHKF